MHSSMVNDYLAQIEEDTMLMVFLFFFFFLLLCSMELINAISQLCIGWKSDLSAYGMHFIMFSKLYTLNQSDEKIPHFPPTVLKFIVIYLTQEKNLWQISIII